MKRRSTRKSIWRRSARNRKRWRKPSSAGWMSATLPRTSTTMAAVSDDEAMLGVFERLALEAGREVMRVFHEGCAVDKKTDSSPVTEADRESEKIILAGLRAAYPHIPCVAEEEVAAGIATPDLDGA